MVCVGGVALYAGKELIDLLIARRQAQGWFELDERELWYDMAADTWFVASGVGKAAAAHAVHRWGLVAFGVALLTFYALGRIFLPAKRSLDRAGLPYMFRLCNFPQTDGVKTDNTKRIRAFITNDKIDGRCASPAVLIQGLRGTGKSTLAIGIGTEVALHKKNGEYGRALYLSAFSLFERGAAKGVGEPSAVKRRTRRLVGTGDPWSIECADVLIIDDVDSDNCIYGGVTPAEILGRLMKEKDLCDRLRRKRTVWVTGTSEFGSETADHGWVAWHKALSDFYGCTVDETRTAGDRDDMAREPIPVIWLTRPLVQESAGPQGGQDVCERGVATAAGGRADPGKSDDVQ